ncbi:MAG: hypothetical protein Q8P45_00125, partial [Candidatus Harrisonbacteria bacterium]|nr:hypothetical protein [Candidatus Harrisonbacteria bacterium]
MLLKSLSSNKLLFVGVAVLLLAVSIFSFSALAQEEEASSSDIRFFLQFLNTGCTEAGETRATYSVQSGLDANGILVKSPSANPDC